MIRRSTRATLVAALLQCVAWAVIGTVSFARRALDDPGRTLGGQPIWAYAEWLTCYLPWGVLSAGIFALERRFPLGRAQWLRHLAILALVSLPASYAAWAMTAALGGLVAALAGRPAHIPPLAWLIPPADLLGHELLYWASVAAASVLRVMREARESERQAARLLLETSRLETTLRQAELDALRMRLQPHFLFNSLQNISVLVRHDADTGARMLTRLGDLLRASLDGGRAAETPLASEIALTQAYLAVEEMRFGDRLSSIVDVGPGTERALVPTFLLQPLVENALRHGLRDVRQHGVVAVRSTTAGDRLVLTVTDNGIGVPGGLSPETYGVGLGATCERLARMYPGRHSFAMRALPTGGTEVRLTVPLRIDASTEVPGHAPAARAHRR